jgi:hypothetical protein
MRHVLRAGSRLVLVLALAGCTPVPEDFGRSPSPVGPGAGSVPSAPAGSPTVQVTGDTVSIVGLGTGSTPEFELPAGSARMVVTPCSSNRVIPFITLFDGDNTNLGLIIDAEKELRNLAGGPYYLSVQANPDCRWEIEITRAS